MKYNYVKPDLIWKTSIQCLSFSTCMDKQTTEGPYCLIWNKENRAKKSLSPTWTGKYWSGLSTFLFKYICFWESVTLLILPQKVQILNAPKGNFWECFACKLLYLLLVSWPLEAFCFHEFFFIPENLILFLVTDSSFTNLPQVTYIPAIYLFGFNGNSETLRSP